MVTVKHHARYLCQRSLRAKVIIVRNSEHTGR